MKTKTTIITSILALLFLHPAWGQENGLTKSLRIADAGAVSGSGTKIKNPTTKPPSRLPTKSKDRLSPLKRTMTIPKSMIKNERLGKPITKKAHDEIDRAYGILRAAMTQYRDADKSFREKWNACQTKSYSVNDQRTAGCKSNDTLARCQAKLVRWCSSRAKHNRTKKAEKLYAEMKKFDDSLGVYCREFKVAFQDPVIACRSLN